VATFGYLQRCAYILTSRTPLRKAHLTEALFDGSISAWAFARGLMLGPRNATSRRHNVTYSERCSDTRRPDILPCGTTHRPNSSAYHSN
jgi:hypothetical protein